MKQPAVYIMANRRNGTLYTGVTSNLAKRVHEHESGVMTGFTSRYGCTRLVYLEVFDEMAAAIAREKQIKAGSRRKKLALIEAVAPGELLEPVTTLPFATGRRARRHLSPPVALGWRKARARPRKRRTRLDTLGRLLYFPPKIDQPVRSLSCFRARVASWELPTALSPGDQTAIDAMSGAIARMPPPTPLLPGSPT
jgi:putative endonuclease